VYIFLGCFVVGKVLIGGIDPPDIFSHG